MDINEKILDLREQLYDMCENGATFEEMEPIQNELQSLVEQFN